MFFIFADKEQISRVFINLLTNAIQSIPEERQGKVSVLLDLTPKTVIIKVIDNGKGIPDELLEKLFVPNFTTKTSGMGLGLAITKNIVENSGGTIRFETKYGVGTTFIVEFPQEGKM
ncbi:MAG: ATP-binding protein [Bacteroidales bacterium]|nr:ATP-binding protein [Bacteroidales bacterium]